MKFFNHMAMGPLMDAASDTAAAAAGTFSAEQKAALTELMKPMLTEAINAAVKGTKNEGAKGVKAVQGQLTELIKGLKPKQARKLMKRLGLEQEETGKTAAELAAETAAAVAAAAAAGKKTPTEEELRGKKPDMYSKRVQTEYEARIAALEADNLKVKAEAKDSRKASLVDRALTDFPWASTDNRDMFRDYCLSKVEWNDEGTELLFGGKDFAKHIAAEIPAKFENLLAPIGKGGAGTSKGQGKAGAIDIDAATDFNSTPAQKAEAAKTLATMMGHQA